MMKNSENDIDDENGDEVNDDDEDDGMSTWDVLVIMNFDTYHA